MKRKYFFIIVGIFLSILSLVLCIFLIKTNKKQTSYQFSPVIVDLDTEIQYDIRKGVLINSLSLLGDNKYPEVAFEEGTTPIPLPDSTIDTNTVVLRYKYSEQGTLVIGGSTSQENIFFEDSELVYLSFIDLNQYQVCGLTTKMSTQDVLNLYGDPVEKQSYKQGDDWDVDAFVHIMKYDDVTYVIATDFINDELYRITINIDNTSIQFDSEEDFIEYLKEKYKDGYQEEDVDAMDSYMITDKDGNLVNQKGEIVEPSNKD